MSDVYIAGQGLAQAKHSIDFPRPDRLVQGNPKRETASLYVHPNMDCGIWQCEVGAWNIVFAPNKQEFFTILEGLVRIHDQHCGYIEVSAGQAGIIPPSFQASLKLSKPSKNTMWL